MKIIVTGGTGFVGQHALGSLLADQHEIVCLVRKAEGIQSVEGVTLVEVDLSTAEGFQSLPARADVILHLAQANVAFPEAADELFSVNTTSTQRLASYARNAGVSQFVYASSGSVYSRSVEPLKETDPVNPQNFYALTKICSEGILSCYKDFFNISILRLFAPYGPGQKGRMIPNIARSVSDGKPVTLLNGGQPRLNPIYIDDLISVIKQTLVLKGYHVVNVAGPETVSVKEVAVIAGKLLGKSPVFQTRTESETWNAIADTSKMHELFRVPSSLGVTQGMRQMLGTELI